MIKETREDQPEELKEFTGKADRLIIWLNKAPVEDKPLKTPLILISTIKEFKELKD